MTDAKLVNPYSFPLTVFLSSLIFTLLLISLPGESSANIAFVSKWGSEGAGDGQFQLPTDVATDSSGNVYVADYQNNRIQKFTSDGAFITKWGSLGSGDGQLSLPYGIGVDLSDNVYVADLLNSRIQKFTSDGVFITKWGSLGSGDGQFNDPADVAVDMSGNIYVVDASNNRIQKFTSDGVFITQWGSNGSGDGQFFLPMRVAVDSSGNVYVADTGNERIQKFTSDGVFITKWGSLGSGNGQFDQPEGLAVDAFGNVYVSERGASAGNCVQKFTSDGEYIAEFGKIGGDGDGEFYLPHGVAVSAWGVIYVVDSGTHHRIQKFIDQDVAALEPKPDFGDVDSTTSDFGDVATANTEQKTITIKNNGNGSTYFYSVDLSGEQFTIISENCSNAILRPGDWCDVVVAFTPIAKGTFAGSLNIWSNSGVYYPLTISLTGTGMGAEPSAPELVTPSDGASADGTTVTFTWNPASGEEPLSYKLFVCERSDFAGCEAIPTSTASGAKRIAPAGLTLLIAGLLAPYGWRNRKNMTCWVIGFLLVGGLAISACGAGTSSSSPTVEGAMKQTVSGLKPSSTYYWKITAETANGFVKDSVVRSLRTGQ